jgi:hypothetical protein
MHKYGRISNDFNCYRHYGSKNVASLWLPFTQFSRNPLPASHAALAPGDIDAVVLLSDAILLEQ